MQINIVPTELTASFDIRLTPRWSKEELLKFLEDVCQQAGPDVSYEYLFHSLDYTATTSLDDSNKFWTTFKTTCDNL